MTLQEYYHYFLTRARQWYSAGEAEAITRILWEDLTGIDRTRLLQADDGIVPPEIREIMDTALSRLEQQEPVQYITGSTIFSGLKMLVNHHVLIPRPETEELVQWISANPALQKNPCQVLDVGTGSGCIAIALKRMLPEVTVTALDASPGALAVAQHNAALHQVSIDFRQLNFLVPAERNALERVHVIVSNPPYIPESEKTQLDANVRLHEPPAALFVPDGDPLLFYRALAAFAGTHLLPGGALYVETHERYAGETAALFRQTFSSVEIKNDLNGRERMIKAFIA
jgi:release factor glutamine methyltransferase